MVSLTLLPKTLVLVLIITFSVALTENLQLADGFSSESKRIIFEMQVGETKSITWGLVNEILEPIDIELYATGPGSELLVFEKYVTIPPQTRVEYEIFVIVPDNHEDNVEFHPNLFALKRGFIEPGKTGAVVNMQMKNLPIIRIGDNPIYTPTAEEISAQGQPTQVELPEEKTKEEKTQSETLEEKLKRIQEANKATAPTVDDVWEEPFEEEAVPDYQPEPMDAEPVATITAVDNFGGEKVECGFIDWLLSLFGMAKC